MEINQNQKMVCYTSCAVAGVFLFSMVYMTFSIDKNSIKDDLMNMLSPELQEKYRQIIKERRDIYLTGFVAGFTFVFGVDALPSQGSETGCAGFAFF